MISGNMPKINHPVGEREIRAALIERIGASVEGVDRPTVREEVKIDGARIDVLRLSDRLEGFEIKSDYDSLSRLPDQVRCFSKALDQITLVVGHELESEAWMLIPKWWGILLAERSRLGGVRFQQVREARANSNDTRLGMAGLLWRNELVDAFESLTGRRSPRAASATTLRQLLSGDASAEELRSVVLERLQNVKRLAAWESAQIPRTTGLFASEGVFAA